MLQAARQCVVIKFHLELPYGLGYVNDFWVTMEIFPPPEPASDGTHIHSSKVTNVSLAERASIPSFITDRETWWIWTCSTG